MSTIEQKTIVRSYKLRIKNKFKSIVEDTENVIAVLKSCVSSFCDEVDTLVNSNDEKFFLLYENLDKDFENYKDKLFFLLASLEKSSEDNVDNSNEIKQLEERQIEAPNSQHESFLNSNEISSSQTICKTLLQSHTSLVSSTSFCSLRDDCSVSQSNLDEIHNSPECSTVNYVEASTEQEYNNIHLEQLKGLRIREDLVNTEPNSLWYSNDTKPESYVSSESSYQSLPSSINATRPSNEAYGNEKCGIFDQNQDQSPQIQRKSRATILYPPISVPSAITATLSHIVDPDNFWMQLEESKELSCFQTEDFEMKTPLLSVQPGDFCLALSNKVNMYYRAKVLTETSVKGKVEVFFIDFGSIQNVPVQNLKVLPEAAYQIPMRAFHCCLYDISPPMGIWSSETIQKFKEYEGTCEVYVKNYTDGKYGVQLMIETIMGFASNVSEVLFEDGFAVYKEEYTQRLPPTSLPTDKVAIQQVSHDSGVSIASNQRLSPTNQRLCFSSEMLSFNSSYMPSEPLQTLQRKTYPKCELTEVEHINIPPFQMEDLISFESAEKMYTEICNESRVKSKVAAIRCLRTAECNCALCLVVLPPFLPIVETDMMLVMLSNIVSPSEFYVNPAMEDSISLDELREQMTNFYESQHENDCISVQDLKVGMFCAGCFYEDQSWYRIKIKSLDFEMSDSTFSIQVQYIDYGNKASIKCSDLRPLKPEFAQYPCFAIRCSLAGIVPLENTFKKGLYSWDKIAVETFKQLTSFERCLTAQIVDSSILNPSSKVVQVLLWDTEEMHDLLINEALVACRVAEFDSSLLSNIQDQSGKQIKELKDLNQWDPMKEDFADIENSYGVDVDNIGIAIAGYEPRDESRICKYFSLRNGFCPNGNNCPFDHVPLAEGGVTRDQEETYSLDNTPSLPAPQSHVFIQVSAVINPGHFYSILPFGNRTPADVNSLVNEGSDPKSLGENDIRALFDALNNHYSDLPFDENTKVALPYGSIVVAWRNVDSSWHRGRIIDVSDIAGPAKVFFVDFGDDSWVSRRKIRKILPQFLLHSFQAIECHLSDVEPLGFDKGKTWSMHAINYFKEVVSDSVFLAHITNRCGKVLHLTLRNTGENNRSMISESLISGGFAQQCSLSPSKRTESIYVPG